MLRWRFHYVAAIKITGYQCFVTDHQHSQTGSTDWTDEDYDDDEVNRYVVCIL